MSDAAAHHARATAVAEKVAKRAEEALAGLEREMVIMKWPAEFRAIMWNAVAAIANQKAMDSHE